MPVNIHGKEYYTVAERVLQLHSDTKKEDPLEILTEIIHCDDKTVVMKATIRIYLKNNLCRVFTGHAHEKFNSNHINKTSALENCETSAVGRALAATGYIGSEYCSADELVNAISNQEPSMKQKKFLNDLMNDKLSEEEREEFIVRAKKAKTQQDISLLIEELKSR
jgi:hypothetical protein